MTEIEMMHEQEVICACACVHILHVWREWTCPPGWAELSSVQLHTRTQSHCPERFKSEHQGAEQRTSLKNRHELFNPSDEGREME